MLVKYFGLVLKDDKELSLRDEFISNGLFRATQPIFLNDKGSEAKLFPYFNEFSPADYEWARKRERKFQLDPNYIPSKDELENLFLKPTGERYGESLPHLVESEFGYKNIDEFDKAAFINAAEQLNSILIELLSCKLGVLSLSKSDCNEQLWTHYASEGKGIAITLDEKHEFFNTHKVDYVSYKPEDRACFTYYKGSMRINGIPLKDLRVDKGINSLSFANLFTNNAIDWQDFRKRLLFSKAEHWSLEDEARIIFDLESADLTSGKNIIPNIDDTILNTTPGFFQNHPEFHFKKIPFSAFKTLVFGYCIDPKIKDKIIDKVKSNPELNHLGFKQVTHNIYGDLESVQIDV